MMDLTACVLVNTKGVFKLLGFAEVRGGVVVEQIKQGWYIGLKSISC